MGLDKTSKSPRNTRNEVIRISFALQKLPTLQFIKHILRPREPITESLTIRGKARLRAEFSLFSQISI